MSLLRFIRRDRDDRKLATVAAPPAPAAPPAVGRPEPVLSAPAANSPLDIERIRRELEEIARIIGSEEAAAGVALSNEIMIEISLSEIIKLAPQAFKNPDMLKTSADMTLSVAVPKLFDQLSKGKVTTKLSHLVVDIPADHLSDFVEHHGNDAIAIPLALVVASIQPGELRKRTASVEKDIGQKNLPNLFGPGIAEAAVDFAPVEASPAPVEPAAEDMPAAPPLAEPAQDTPVQDVIEISEHESAAVEQVETVSYAEPAPEPATPVEQPISIVETEPVDVVTTANVETVSIPEAEPVAETVHQVTSGPDGAEDDGKATSVLLGGIDINIATAEELTQRLDGVGLRLARKIVENRQAHGPFSDLYDVARVPGLRAKRFEQLTGLAWSAAYFRYREIVNQIIGAPDGEIPDVRQVSARFSELTGFVGCMIIHEDGLVLATSWNHASSDALGAFAPQMFKKISKYVKPLKLGEMSSICFFVGHQPITVIHSGQIYFAALHQPESLTKKQVSIAQALATELGRRFIH